MPEIKVLPDHEKLNFSYYDKLCAAADWLIDQELVINGVTMTVREYIGENSDHSPNLNTRIDFPAVHIVALLALYKEKSSS